MSSHNMCADFHNYSDVLIAKILMDDSQETNGNLLGDLEVRLRELIEGPFASDSGTIRLYLFNRNIKILYQKASRTAAFPVVKIMIYQCLLKLHLMPTSKPSFADYIVLTIENPKLYFDEGILQSIAEKSIVHLLQGGNTLTFKGFCVCFGAVDSEEGVEFVAAKCKEQLEQRSVPVTAMLRECFTAILLKSNGKQSEEPFYTIREMVSGSERECPQPVGLGSQSNLVHVAKTATRPIYPCQQSSLKNVHAIFNPGNLCFVNSILQALVHTQVFYASLHDQVSNARTDDDKGEVSACLAQVLQKINDHSTSSLIVLNEEVVKKLLPPGVVYGEQDDAAAFLRHILLALSQESFERNRGPIFEQAHIVDHMVCSDCGRSVDMIRSEDINVINLPVPNQSNPIIFAEILNSFLAPQASEQDPQFCPSCKRLKKVFQKSDIINSPNMLFFCLTIFTYNSSIKKLQKVETPIVVNTLLELNGKLYKKECTVHHIGETFTSGHYTTDVMLSGKQEVTILDNKVVNTRPVKIQGEELPYVIIFSKTDDA